MDTGAVVGFLAGGCFVTLFIGIGVFMLFKYFQDKKKTEESQAWSATSGRVTESYVRREVSRDSDGDTTVSYYPEVRYIYQVMGVEYTGSRVAFGGTVGRGRKKSEEKIANYPVGKPLTVYYDPNNAEDAVIERRMGSQGMLIMGIIFALIGICTACIGGAVGISALLGA